MDIVARLREIVGTANVLTGEDMAPHCVDWRGRYRGAARCVVRPGSTDETAAVVRVCAEARVPVVPQGGNTSLCGGATPDDAGTAVVVAMGRMNRVRAIDTENGTLTAEAGCPLAAVQAAAHEAGRLFPSRWPPKARPSWAATFPPTPAACRSPALRQHARTDAGAGSGAALRRDLERPARPAQGQHRLRPETAFHRRRRYARPHHCRNDEALRAADGGGHGVGFPCHPRARRSGCWAHCRPPSALAHRLRTGVRGVARPCPAAHPERRPAARRQPWYVLIELSSGGDDAELRERLEGFLGTALEQSQCDDAVVARSEAAGAPALGAARKHLGSAEDRGHQHQARCRCQSRTSPVFLDQAGAALAARWPDLRVVAFGHVGDGNLHYNPLDAGGATTVR